MEISNKIERNLKLQKLGEDYFVIIPEEDLKKLGVKVGDMLKVSFDVADSPEM